MYPKHLGVAHDGRRTTTVTCTDRKVDGVAVRSQLDSLAGAQLGSKTIERLLVPQPQSRAAR